MGHAWDRREMHAGFWLGNLKERDCLENLGLAHSSVILKQAFKNRLEGYGVEFSSSG